LDAGSEIPAPDKMDGIARTIWMDLLTLITPTHLSPAHVGIPLQANQNLLIVTGARFHDHSETHA
jgi:hypothetical protein